MIYVSYTIVYVFDIHCTQLIVKTQKSFAGCPGRESFPSWRRWQLKPLPLPAEIQRFIMFATKKLLSFGGVSRICFINPYSNLWVSQRLWWGRCGWNCQKKCRSKFMVNHGTLPMFWNIVFAHVFLWFRHVYSNYVCCIQQKNAVKPGESPKFSRWTVGLRYVLQLLSKGLANRCHKPVINGLNDDD